MGWIQRFFRRGKAQTDVCDDANETPSCSATHSPETIRLAQVLVWLREVFQDHQRYTSKHCMDCMGSRYRAEEAIGQIQDILDTVVGPQALFMPKSRDPNSIALLRETRAAAQRGRDAYRVKNNMIIPRTEGKDDPARRTDEE